MYSRVYNFFTKDNLIYPLQFGFRQQYSTFHALISLTEDIRKNLDKGNISCGVFVDLQKPFDTIEHDITASSLNPTSLTENNLFLLIAMYLIKPLQNMGSHKVQFLDHFCS